MKLRIRGNSLRLRLLQNEVTALAETGAVSEAISFGDTALTYAVESSALADDITARFTDNQVIVTIPETTVKNWANSTEVTLEKDQQISEAETLKILIEKDFVCIGREDDPDNADAFPNPAQC